MTTQANHRDKKINQNASTNLQLQAGILASLASLLGQQV
jgi:hypothetical protein